MRNKSFMLVIALMSVLTISSCSNNSTQKTNTPEDNTNMSMDNNSMWMMDHSMHMWMIKNEEDFLIEMIPHHQEAIVTSKILLEKTQKPELKKLAQDIITAQESEVEIMNNLIKEKYPNSTKTSSYQNMMRTDLWSLDVEEMEKEYLKWMVVHHAWAIQMAESMSWVDADEKTKTIVDNIIKSQQSEIDFMNNFLKNYK